MKQLKDVHAGSRCQHTGMTIIRGRAIPTKFHDEGLHFVKQSDAIQVLTPSGHEAIFGGNDLVRVMG